MTETITTQIELGVFRNELHPRDSHGHWIKKAPGEQTIARQLRREGYGPESIREALYAHRKKVQLKKNIAAAVHLPSWHPDSNARANKAMGWPSLYNKQKREHEDAAEQLRLAKKDAERLAKEDKFRAAGIAAQAERNAMLPPPWTPTAELRQKQHENRRAAGNTWTVDEQGQIIRGAHPGIHGQAIFGDLVKRKSVTGHWKFLHGGNREVTEPQVGDTARMPLGGQNNLTGTVISVAGGHAVIDSDDDGNRYLVDWRNGGIVRQVQPLSQLPPTMQALPNRWAGMFEPLFPEAASDWSPPPWVNSEDTPDPEQDSILGKGLKFRLIRPRPGDGGTKRWVARDPNPPNGNLAPWLIHTGDGDEFHISDAALAYLEPKASPPGTVLGPGIKQLMFPGMPEPEQDIGHTSKPVKKLLDEIGNGALDEGESGEPDDPRGQQSETSVVTLPDGYTVIHKRGQPVSRADREELSYYVSQAIDGGAPPVARVPGTEADLVEGFVPGQTGNRFLQEHEDDYDAAEEALKTSPKGRKIALLDRLISNSDRNIGNWMVDENGDPVPIDHGQAEFDGIDYGGENDDGSYDHWTIDPDEMTPDYVNELRGKLEALEPEFIRLGREDWYEGMIQALGDLPVNMDYATISGQVTELGWRFNPAEKRDKHGRWTTGGKSYTIPDPARLNVKPNKSPINYPRPQDHPFFKEHPVSPANIVRAYQASTAQEKAQGMRWYADVHLLASKMADGDARKGAILLAAYSPQANWPVDLLNAARAAEENRALGPHDGLISGDMQANAQEALDGASVEEALQAPKTLAFARLIEHGGDTPDDEYGQVVIDRHAASVAVGEQLPNHSPIPIGKARYHEYVADQYREAARQLNEAGTKIAPHQLQAITWLHQQAANQAGNAVQAADATSKENARAKGRKTALKNAWARWMSYAGAEGLPLHPGTTSLAQVVSDWNAAVAGTVELAAWEHELRDHRGRWMKAGTVDPYVSGKQYLAKLDENEANADISDVEFTRLLGMSKRGRLLDNIVRNAVFAGKNTSTSETIGGVGAIYKPERARLHNQLVDEAMSRAASVPAEGKAILGGGLPGAGKTTALKILPGVDVSQYMTVAPDDFKEELAKRGMIPHIHGLSPMEASPLVADETLHIASLLYERAKAAHKNMIIDLTMMPSEHTEERVADLHKEGYKVRGVYVDVPIATSIKRAQSRYEAGAADWLKGKGFGGRYVPPGDIQNVWGTRNPDVSQNETYFEHIKSFVDEWQKMDNSVAGRKPQLIASSGQKAAA